MVFNSEYYFTNIKYFSSEESFENSNKSDNVDIKKNERPEILDLTKPGVDNAITDLTKPESKLPVSRQRSIPSPS